MVLYSRIIIAISLLFLLISIEPSAIALERRSSLCRSMLNDIKQLDSSGRNLFQQYSKSYSAARDSGSQVANIVQTRALLELLENDRSTFLRALESPKCFNKTELLNLKETLKNTSDDARTVKSWLDVQLGIPGRNFYQRYIEFSKYITTPSAFSYCPKAGQKYKDLICRMTNGELRWQNREFSINSSRDVTWPTGFIDNQVNLIEAISRIVKYFEENSRVFSSSGIEAVEFMKSTSYPNLFDFNSDQMIKKCNDYIVLQDAARPIRVKFNVSVEGIKPDPDFVIVDGAQGQRILNTKFSGQVFSVPVRLEVNKDEISDPGTVLIRRVAIINGLVHRFSVC